MSPSLTKHTDEGPSHPKHIFAVFFGLERSDVKENKAGSSPKAFFFFFFTFFGTILSN